MYIYTIYTYVRMSTYIHMHVYIYIYICIIYIYIYIHTYNTITHVIPPRYHGRIMCRHFCITVVSCSANLNRDHPYYSMNVHEP